jgi:hypothetical protein
MTCYEQEDTNRSETRSRVTNNVVLEIARLEQLRFKEVIP